MCPIGQLRAADKLIAVDHNSDAGLERIRHLGWQVSRALIDSGRHRLLAKAVRLEAPLFRKSLDSQHASEQFDPKPKLRLTSRVSQLGVPEKARVSNERESNTHSFDRARPLG